jgi:hypothetical protein
MKLTNCLGGNNCWGGECPTIYKSDRGTFVVQGSLISANELNDVNIPSHEGVVEIPEALLRAVAEKLVNK